MKRPHRSIETFDISLMAVVTKAMGAFLVLMLLLMPYYTSEPLGDQDVSDLAKQAEAIKDDISKILKTLEKAPVEDLRKQLEEALRKLEEAQKKIEDLARAIDQLNAQKARLENENAALKEEIDALKRQVADLNAKLAAAAAQIATLNAKIAQLESEIASLKDEIARLERENDELKRQIEPLRQQVARLEKENEELRNIVEPLRRQVEQLQKENEELRKIVDPLKRENDELKERLRRLAGIALMGGAVVSGCDDVNFALGLGAEGMTTTTEGASSSYFLNVSNGLGSIRGSGGIAVRGVARTQFLYRGAPPSTYHLLLISREPIDRSERGRMPPLQQPGEGCFAIVGLDASFQGEGLNTVNTREFKVDPSSYVMLVGDLVVTETEAKLVDPSPQAAAWLQDQLDHADKSTAPPRTRGGAPRTGFQTPMMQLDADRTQRGNVAKDLGRQATPEEQQNLQRIQQDIAKDIDKNRAPMPAPSPQDRTKVEGLNKALSDKLKGKAPPPPPPPPPPARN